MNDVVVALAIINRSVVLVLSPKSNCNMQRAEYNQMMYVMNSLVIFRESYQVILASYSLSHTYALQMTLKNLALQDQVSKFHHQTLYPHQVELQRAAQFPLLVFHRCLVVFLMKLRAVLLCLLLLHQVSRLWGIILISM